MASRFALVGSGALLLAGSTVVAACVDALRLEPPPSGPTTSTASTTGGAGGGVAGGAQGGGGASTGGEGGATPTIACQSSTDCPEPTAVCDTVKGHCVECLVLADCAFRPGTVCTEGQCACPGEGTYCGPDVCVDTDSDPQNCGACGHACFGACVAGTCADAWEPTAAKDAPDARAKHVAVWTDTRMVVWGGTTNGAASGAVNTGGMYDPAGYAWTPTTLVNAPAPRIEASVVWTGSEMIVWGGRDASGNYLADGGRFDPAANAWKAVSANGAPTARTSHTAVWSGSIMIVWGGVDGSNQLNSGGRYDPKTDSWQATALIPYPAEPRERHSAVWDDVSGRMLLYGGYGDGPTTSNIYLPNDSVTGGRTYNPTTDTWDSLANGSQPSARADHTATWDGARMLVFGGTDGTTPYLDTGLKYENSTWTVFNGTPPPPRHRHTAVWLEGPKRLIVWGGRNATGLVDTGGLVDPLNNTWDGPTPVVLSARELHTAVAAGDTMIVWGGQTNSGVTNTGGVLTPP